MDPDSRILTRVRVSLTARRVALMAVMFSEMGGDFGFRWGMRRIIGCRVEQCNLEGWNEGGWESKRLLGTFKVRSGAGAFQEYLQ